MKKQQILAKEVLNTLNTLFKVFIKEAELYIKDPKKYAKTNYRVINKVSIDRLFK